MDKIWNIKTKSAFVDGIIPCVINIFYGIIDLYGNN